MEKLITMVEQFHRATNNPINEPNLLVNDDEGDSLEFIKLRCKLHEEECSELNEELWSSFAKEKTTTNLLKESADLLYVLLGTLVALGVADKLEEAFTRVHLSNMSKLDENGKPIYRNDGKVMKGPNYKPPNLDDLIGNLSS